MPDVSALPIVSIDRDVCMGSGVCLVYAPGTFVHDDQSKAVLVDRVSDTIETIQVAVEACPTGALSVSIDGSGA